MIKVVIVLMAFEVMEEVMVRLAAVVVILWGCYE